MERKAAERKPEYEHPSEIQVPLWWVALNQVINWAASASAC